MAAASISRFSLTPHLSNSANYYSSVPFPSYVLTFQTKSRTLRKICCVTINSVSSANEDISSSRNDAAENLRVVFAAGGTGGHIYPAVAIADELKLLDPNAEILFLGIPNSMESDAIPSAGYEFQSVSAVQLVRPIFSLENLLLPYRLMKCLIESDKKLRDFRPHIVVGTGGYVSFPTCLAAAVRGFKLVIQEQNSVPGIANWALSFLADVVFVAFNSTVNSFPKKKCVVSGNPVRLSLRRYASKAVARTHFFPKSAKPGDSEAKVILILGGSLGAHAVNIAMLNLYRQMLLKNDRLFIIWQTGIEAFDEMESLVRSHPNVLLTPFMHSMDMAYAAADLIISRAGAMTCYEILATGKPSILIPSSNVAEGHQFKNASLMADLAGSKVIIEEELDSSTLAIAIEEILGNESKMAEMSERALKVARPGAAAEIAQHILSLVNS